MSLPTRNNNAAEARECRVTPAHSDRGYAAAAGCVTSSPSQARPSPRSNGRSANDLPEYRYHLPRTYLRQVEAAKGDWIVYYEPRRASGTLSSRGGGQAYFATDRVTEIESDLTLLDNFDAYINDCLDFDRAVPFREGVHYYEAALRRDDGETSKGAFGRAVSPTQ
jgi:hypothetical protein